MYLSLKSITHEKGNDIAKLLVLLNIFGSLKVLLENTVKYMRWISVNRLSNTLGFKLYFESYTNYKTRKVFIWEAFTTFISLSNDLECASLFLL